MNNNSHFSQDVERFAKFLGERVVESVLVPSANHYDFIWSATADMDFYQPIIQFINARY